MNEFEKLEAAAVKYLNSLTLKTTNELTMKELEGAREWFRKNGKTVQLGKINAILRLRVSKGQTSR